MSSKRRRRKALPADVVPVIADLDRMFPPSPDQPLRDDEMGADMDIAQLVYDAREGAKLTQTGLAELIGTTQSVISRLEDWDYHGHSLKMLVRVAHALGKKVELRLVPKDEPESAAPAKRKRRPSAPTPRR